MKLKKYLNFIKESIKEDILTKGEDISDNYYSSEYQPDIPSMFQYTLTKEKSLSEVTINFLYMSLN
jgi:hypothetical protein